MIPSREVIIEYILYNFQYSEIYLTDIFYTRFITDNPAYYICLYKDIENSKTVSVYFASDIKNTNVYKHVIRFSLIYDYNRKKTINNILK